MKAIGGYFGMEFGGGKDFHEKALLLNTGRNALEYILLANNYKKIYLPFFTCKVLLEPIKKLKVDVVFYSINKLFEPLFDYSKIKQDEVFLYTNYFGLKDKFIKELAVICENLIIDNAQSFFSKPVEGIDTFYSPRKFFGVPDGSYLYCKKRIKDAFKKDESYERFQHLLRRIDLGAEDGYSFFIENEQKLNNQPIKQMSNLTQTLLASINYDNSAKVRRENFAYLHRHLKKSNLLEIILDDESVPMVYPYWSTDTKLRENLMVKKIFTASYWPNVLEWCSESGLEYRMTKEIVYLPIDQRYGIQDLKYILEYV